MAVYPSAAKAQVDKGLPPYLNSQITRGQVLKKTIVIQPGDTTIPASSVIQDIDLPQGVVIDVSSIALTHDGVGAGSYNLELGVTDKNGELTSVVNKVGLTLATLATTTTAGEIVRNGTAVDGKMLADPYEMVANSDALADSGIPKENLKAEYHFCLVVKNTASIPSNKTVAIVVDCIIP